MQTKTLGLLKTRRFLPLFITQFLGAFNDNVFKNALVILITYHLADKLAINAQLFVTLIAGLFILPFFLFSATAGQLADKWSKTSLVQIIKAAEIVVMLFAAIGFFYENLYLLMLVLFMLGVHSTFFGPLKYSLLPEQLAEDELFGGNSLVEAGTFIAILSGTIFGGLYILKPYGIWIVSFVCLLVAGLGFSSSLFLPQTVANHPTLRISWRIWLDIYQLLKLAYQKTPLLITMLGISWFWLVGATFLAQFPSLAQHILFADQTVVTFFLVLFSVGMAAGSLFSVVLQRFLATKWYMPIAAFALSLFAIDLCYAAMHFQAGFMTHYLNVNEFLGNSQGLRISCDLFAMAMCGGIYTVPLYVLLQQLSESPMRARVIACNNILNALFMVLSALGSMLLLKLGFSVVHIFLLVAVGNIGIAAMLCKVPGDR